MPGGTPPMTKRKPPYTQYSGHIQYCNGSTLTTVRLVLTAVHRCYHIFCARPMGWSWIDDVLGLHQPNNYGFWMFMKFTFNVLDMDIVSVCFSCVYMSKGWFEWNDPNAFLKNPRKKRICPICGESNPIQTYLGVSENSVPLNPMVLLIIIPMKNSYFIGNINPTFSDKPICFPKIWWWQSYETNRKKIQRIFCWSQWSQDAGGTTSGGECPFGDEWCINRYYH